jgi:syntaxin 1B/2/3
MSQNYGNQQGGGYGQYDPYSQQSNPYDPPQPPAQSQRYHDVETGNGGYEMGQANNTTSILNKCTEINDGLRELRTKREGRLAQAQHELLDSSTGKEDQAARQNLDYVEDDINNTFRYLRDLLKKIKQTPGSGDSRVQTQIDVTSRNLRKEIEQYQKAQSEFQKRLQEQVRRRYEIANPDATPDQVDQGVQAVLLGQEQSFQSTGLRTRQANDARQAALERSTAIRKIEQDMIELARLYQEVAELVQQQEPAVEQINQGAHDVVENVDNANKQIDSAIVSARNARRWKWYILIAVILIIVIVVGVAVGVTEANKH